MTTEIIFRYVHFLSILGIFASLVAEHLLIAKSMTRAQIRRVSTIDAIFGLSALLALISGLLLWFVVGKPAEVYTQNGVFHAKIMLFVIVGLASIYPTLFFVKNRKGDATQTIDLPKPLIMVVRLELLIVALMPLLATMMSRGIGYFGG